MDEERVRALEQEIAGSREALGRVESQLAHARGLIDSQERELAAAAGSAATLESELASARRSVRSLEHEIATSRDSFSAIELVRARGVVEGQHSDLMLTGANAAKLERELEGARRRIGGQELEFEQARSVAADLESQVRRSASQSRELAADVSTWRLRAEHQESQMAVLRRTLTRLKRESGQ